MSGYCVRVTLPEGAIIADGEFLEALEAAGLIRVLDAPGGLCLDLVAPYTISAANTAAWAARTVERIIGLYAWTVEIVPADSTTIN